MPEPAPPSSAADRNLLFGILALQMDFIHRDQLVAAMNAWVLDKKKSLGQILSEQSALQDDTHRLLDALVDKHLGVHGNDPQVSLAALGGCELARDQLRRIADDDLQESLAHFSMRLDHSSADATHVESVGMATSEGQRFRIVRPHAEGGLGRLYVARDEELGREVVLKEIKDRYVDQPQSRARFMLEAEVTGRLEHPGIVPVYGLGKHPDGRPYYAMRLIRGKTLKEAIAEFHSDFGKRLRAADRELQLRRLLGHFIDVCEVIEYAHSRGVLHRDLKPANIMIGKFGETLVVDWGLAKPIGRSKDGTGSDEVTLLPDSTMGSDETLPGEVVGTPQFMSPEQAEGRHEQLRQASDVYSLGATLYVLLTGRTPFPDMREIGVGGILHRVRHGDFPAPRTIDPSIPKALEAIGSKAMALKPEDRYASAQSLKRDLEQWLADQPVDALPETWLERAWRWARAHKLLVGSAAAAIFGALLVGSITQFIIYGLQRDRLISTSQVAINAELDRADWTAANLRSIESLISELGAVDQEKAVQTQGAVVERLYKHLKTTLGAPRLLDHEQEQAKSAINWLRQRDEARADELKKQLDGREIDWVTLAKFDYETDGIGKLFDPQHSGIHKTNDGLRHDAPFAISGGPFVLPTLVDSSPNIRVDVTFSAVHWQSATELGIDLDWRAGDDPSQRYSFILRNVASNDPSTNSKSTSRDLPTGSKALARLQIVRHGALLHEQTVEAPEGKIKLEVVRDGDRLSFVLNHRNDARLQFEELIPQAIGRSGVVALRWPPKTVVERLQVQSRKLSPFASVLERGDNCFAQGLFHEALDKYRDHSLEAHGPEIAEEKLCKEGLCLYKLSRLDDAAEVFRRVSTRAEGRWPTVAACYRWLILLKQNRLDEADAILQSLANRLRFDEVASFFPEAERAAILASYRPNRNSAYEMVRRDTRRIERLKNLATAELLLVPTANDRMATYESLVEAYMSERQVDDVLHLLNKLTSVEQLDPRHRLWAMEQWLWHTCGDKQAPEQALARVNQWLELRASAEGQAYWPLYLGRARIHAKMANWDAANADLDSYVAAASLWIAPFRKSKEQPNLSQVWLVRGFIHAARGDRDQAQAAWLEGYKEIRRNKNLHYISGSILASISNQLSEEDFQLMIDGVLGAIANRNPFFDFAKLPLFPKAELTPAFRKMWQSERGLEYARRIAFHDIPVFDSFVVQSRLSVEQMVQLGAFGGNPNPEQAAAIWNMTDQLFAAFRKQVATEAELAHLIYCWFGRSAAFDIIAPKVPGELRSTLAYFYGRRYHYHFNRPTDAQRFYQLAMLPDADPMIRKLAQVELDQIGVKE